MGSHRKCTGTYLYCISHLLIMNISWCKIQIPLIQWLLGKIYITKQVNIIYWFQTNYDFNQIVFIRMLLYSFSLCLCNTAWISADRGMCKTIMHSNNCLRGNWTFSRIYSTCNTQMFAIVWASNHLHVNIRCLHCLMICNAHLCQAILSSFNSSSTGYQLVGLYAIFFRRNIIYIYIFYHSSTPTRHR